MGYGIREGVSIPFQSFDDMVFSFDSVTGHVADLLPIVYCRVIAAVPIMKKTSCFVARGDEQVNRRTQLCTGGPF